MTPDYHDSRGAEFSSGQISPVREAAMGISTDTFYSFDLKPNQTNFDPSPPPIAPPCCSNEAPILFSRHGWYYLLYGHTCCFCQPGSGARVQVSSHWRRAGHVTTAAASDWCRWPPTPWAPGPTWSWTSTRRRRRATCWGWGPGWCPLRSEFKKLLYNNCVGFLILRLGARLA